MIFPYVVNVDECEATTMKYAIAPDLSNQFRE
jgi:hypothetical protein